MPNAMKIIDIAAEWVALQKGQGNTRKGQDGNVSALLCPNTPPLMGQNKIEGKAEFSPIDFLVVSFRFQLFLRARALCLGVGLGSN